MMETRGKSVVSFDWRLLGVGVFFGAFLCLIQNNSPLFDNPANTGDGIAFVVNMLLGIVACSLVELVINAFTRKRKLRRASRPGNIVAAIGYIFIAAAVPLIDIYATQGATSAVLLASAGFAVGAGCLLIMSAWSAVYADLLPESLLFHSALALGLAASLFTLNVIPPLYENCLIYLLVLMAASALPLFSLTRGTKKPQGSSADEAADATSVSDTSVSEKKDNVFEFKPLVMTFVRTLWMPVFGAVLASFIIGLIWDTVASQAAKNVLGASGLDNSLIGPLLACLLVLISIKLSPKSFTLHRFCGLVLPLSIAVLLVMPSFDPATTAGSYIYGIIDSAAFCLVALGFWTGLTGAVRTTDVPSWFIFPAGCALVALSMLLGTSLIHVIGTGGRALCLVLLTVFLLLAILEYTLRDNTRKESRRLERNVFEQYLRERCDELSKRYGLSAREQEVFIYLARGYSHVYIATELYVSENTIRTHVRHIYTKLGINSKEELLALIDDRD